MTEKPFIVGDHVFGRNAQPTFYTWCQRKGYDIKEIEKMKPEDKIRLVLRWKWFTTDDHCAKECDKSRQMIIERYLQTPPTCEGEVYWLKNAIKVEREVNQIRAYLGLISQNEAESLNEKYRNI